MCQNLPWNISKSRPHTSSIFMSFSIKSRRWNSKIKWKPEPEVVFCAILVKTKFLGFLGLVSRWYVYVRRQRDRQIDLSTNDALDRRRGLETELLCPGAPTPITLSVMVSGRVSVCVRCWQCQVVRGWVTRIKVGFISLRSHTRLWSTRLGLHQSSVPRASWPYLPIRWGIVVTNIMFVHDSVCL